MAQQKGERNGADYAATALPSLPPIAVRLMLSSCASRAESICSEADVRARHAKAAKAHDYLSVYHHPLTRDERRKAG